MSRYPVDDYGNYGTVQYTAHINCPNCFNRLQEDMLMSINELLEFKEWKRIDDKWHCKRCVDSFSEAEKNQELVGRIVTATRDIEAGETVEYRHYSWVVVPKGTKGVIEKVMPSSYSKSGVFYTIKWDNGKQTDADNYYRDWEVEEISV